MALNINYTLKPNIFPQPYYPDFHIPGRWLARVEGFLGELELPVASDGTKAFKHKLSLQVDFNGSGHLFCGRAAERIDERLLFLPAVVAGNMLRFLILLGELYDRARYFGMVDVGVALTGLKGCVLPQNQWDDPLPYDRDEYRRTVRVSALGLKDTPEETARNLSMPLFNAISQGRLNLFPEKPKTQ